MADLPTTDNRLSFIRAAAEPPSGYEAAAHRAQVAPTARRNAFRRASEIAFPKQSLNSEQFTKHY
jgi:hypothetical protein